MPQAVAACPVCWGTLEEWRVSQRSEFREATHLPVPPQLQALYEEKVPYLYVTCTAVPGSSLSQIKATLSGDFATC